MRGLSSRLHQSRLLAVGDADHIRLEVKDAGGKIFNRVRGHEALSWEEDGNEEVGGRAHEEGRKEDAQ
jgi:hypothetical protein